MATVVQEVNRSRLRNEPFHSRHHVVTIWPHGSARIGVLVIAENDLRSLIGGIARLIEELAHVLDILMTSLQSMLTCRRN